MSHAIQFIETSLFTRQIRLFATDEEIRLLQCELISFPDKGDIIQGTGGLRKIRMAIGQQGKRSSIRIIYFLATRETIYFILAYQKSIKDNLTESEKAELKKLTKQLKSEV